MTASTIAEICVDGVASAVAAERGGADRVELCVALGAGGLTPSAGLIATTRRAISIGLHVLIRPRAGDFVLSDDECAVCLLDIRCAVELGADGVVVGALDTSGSIDETRVRALIDAARPLSVTFHRAFDVVPEPLAALETLAALGVDRVLTSGGAASAWEGRERLRELVVAARGRVAIIAGAGVNASNVGALIRLAGVSEIHAGGGVASVAPAAAPLPAHWRSAFGTRPDVVDAARVAALVQAARA